MGLIVLGAGGHARVVLDVLDRIGRRALRVIDDDAALWGSDLDGVLVAGPVHPLERVIPEGTTEAFVAVGRNDVRQRFQQLVIDARLDVPILVHPAAVLSHRSRLGPGTLVCAGAIVGAGTTVAAGVIVNTGAQIDHDCTVGPFAHLAPGVVLCGGVTVGARALVGAGATVKPGMRVGCDSVIGVGAVVVDPVPDGVTVVGVPARPLRESTGPRGVST